MLIGIIETGRPPEELADEYGSYPLMFQRLLGKTGQSFDYRVYNVLDANLPYAPHECDAWLITGSKHGVYEQLPWMLQLQHFIREVHDAKVPMVGICFGHQLIAQALGGNVEKSPKGWGIGLHEYQINQAIPHAEPVKNFRVYAMHQDQVTQLPPHAQVLASSDFCENAVLLYGDSILTFQGHPEFFEEFEKDLLYLRKGEVIPTEQADAVLKEIAEGKSQSEGEKVGQWMANFLKQSAA